MADPQRLAELHLQMQRLSLTVGVAESLTGGLVLAALTETAGASASVRGGMVVYATDLKASLAGVDEALLAARGAVDPDVAIALARGARSRLEANIGIGVTGVAGPDPQDGKPVGTVYVAVSSSWYERVGEWLLEGARHAIRQAAVELCLDAVAAAIADHVQEPTRESERGSPR